MHPVEHLLYFSGVLIQWIVPSLSPPCDLPAPQRGTRLRSSGTSASTRSTVGKDGVFDGHAYAHYLHHKYFEVNYADGLVPIDKWLGTWHDGTPEGEALMQARYERRQARATGQRLPNEKSAMSNWIKACRYDGIEAEDV